MALYSLFEAPNLTIWHDCSNHWLYVEWKGEQSLEMIQVSCQYAMQHLPLSNYTKVLNDSTQATGNWAEAAQWLGKHLFPQLAKMGLTYMAWVYAVDFNSRFAIDATLRCATGLTIVTFDDLDAACTWLQHADTTLTLSA
jgi:hypothetical protein